MSVLVRAGFILRALGVGGMLVAVQSCDLFSGTSGQGWARAESTGFVLIPGEESPAGLVVGSPQVGFAGGLRRSPTHPGTAIWQISDTAIVSAPRPVSTILALRPGRAVLRGVASNFSDSASVTVVADSGAVRLEARSVHTGGGFTCAVRLDNRIVCWGSSWYGELGNGAVRKFTATLSPVPIATTQSLHSLQSGWNHSCALDATNRAWCWGVNVARQISDAQVSQYPLPELFANGRTFSSIAPGGSVTCGLSSGIIACKGAGLSGIEEFSAARPLMSLRAGALHVCALDDSQHIWCRGENLRGQLGVATTPYSHQLIAVDTAHTYLNVSLGPSNTCGLTTERTVRCWGYGENGELGTGDRRSSVDPVDVPLPAPAVQISVGGRSVCALLTTQHVYCWGYNLDGGLGNGTPPRSPTTDDLVFPSPVPVATALRFKQVAASRGGATCGISLSDVVYCWGKNLEGAVGAGRHATTQLWPEQSFFWTPTLVRSVAP